MLRNRVHGSSTWRMHSLESGLGAGYTLRTVTNFRRSSLHANAAQTAASIRPSLPTIERRTMYRMVLLGHPKTSLCTVFVVIVSEDPGFLTLSRQDTPRPVNREYLCHCPSSSWAVLRATLQKSTIGSVTLRAVCRCFFLNNLRETSRDGHIEPTFPAPSVKSNVC